MSGHVFALLGAFFGTITITFLVSVCVGYMWGEADNRPQSHVNWHDHYKSAYLALLDQHRKLQAAIIRRNRLIARLRRHGLFLSGGEPEAWLFRMKKLGGGGSSTFASIDKDTTEWWPNQYETVTRTPLVPIGAAEVVYQMEPLREAAKSLHYHTHQCWEPGDGSENSGARGRANYGDGGTIHNTGKINIEMHANRVVSVWFRCQPLPFTQHDVMRERAEDMRKMYERGDIPELRGIEVRDVK